MKIKRLKPLLAGAIVLPAATQGAWTLIDDFNDADFSNFTLARSGAESEIAQYSDPTDDSNSGMFLWSGEIGVDWADTWAALTLPDSIDVGETATVYLRLLKEGHSNNWHIGFTDLAPSELDAASWGGFAGYARMSMNQTFDIRNSGSWGSFDPNYELSELNAWYHFWFVIDYQSPIENASYQFYSQGPGDSEPVLRMISTESGPVEGALFRHDPAGNPITTLAFMTNSDNPVSPNAGDIWIMDDLNVDFGGENLTIPGEAPAAETWGGFTILEDHYVDTGAWMGWLYAEHRPWMYSTSLNGWLWAPDPGADASGTWAYVINVNP